VKGYGGGITAGKVAGWVKKGHGQGSGKSYSPWIMARDISSTGLTTREKGWKTGRVHHVLSNHELHYLYLLEWSPIVLDIREQYPLLPLAKTIGIANRLGIRHPVDTKTQEPIVMTTDFLLDVTERDHVRLKARTVKPEQKLSSSFRVVEKFEIERVYWQERGIDWGIVTEKEIPEALVRNVEFLHAAKDITSMPGLGPSDLLVVEPVLFDLVSAQKESLAKAALAADEKLGLSGGTSLRVIKYLLANRFWLTDMEKPIDTARPLRACRAGMVMEMEAS